MKTTEGSQQKIPGKKAAGDNALNNFGLNRCLFFSFFCLIALAVSARPAPAQINVANANSVTIVNTGYGILPGYQIEVDTKGQISATWHPRNRPAPVVRTDQMTNLNRQQFFRDLAKAGALNAISVGNGQSAATGRRGRRGRNPVPSTAIELAGPQVFVFYRGQRTPNLRVVGSAAGKALYQDVKKIMLVLRLPIPNYP